MNYILEVARVVGNMGMSGEGSGMCSRPSVNGRDIISTRTLKPARTTALPLACLMTSGKLFTFSIYKIGVIILTDS